MTTRVNLKRLPILRGKRADFPSKPLCPVCRRKKVLEPHSFVVVSAGALMKLRGGVSGPDPRMEGFWDITWHGAHDGGQGEHPGVHTHAPIAWDVAGGQFDIYFCSTRCLRRFFSGLVDELDRRIRRESRRTKAKR